MKITIEGLQEAQQANAQIINALQPKGAYGRAVQFMTTEAHRRAIANTPWDTGGLRAAHRMKIKGLRARVYLDPGARNPRQGNRRPAEYGFELHKQGLIPGIRGGIRAFYQYTVDHDGPKIAKRAISILRKGLP